MLRCALVTISVLFLAAAAWGFESGDVDKNLREIDSRRDRMLRSMLERPYPESGAWRHEGFALAAYWLDARRDEADEAIATVAREEFPKLLAGNDFHWHACILQRIYFLFAHDSSRFPGRMSSAAEKALVDMLWRWAAPSCRREMALPARDTWRWGSENHHAQAWAGFWGAAQIFNRRADYRDRRYADGTSPAEMSRAFNDYYRRYARQHAAWGLLVECNSDYNKYTLGGWYNLADFAEDIIVRRRVQMLLELYWADWASEQIDGVRGGSRHRCYPGRSSTGGSSGDGPAWYHFGLGTPLSKHPSVLCAATTSWRPDPCVVAMALDAAGRGVYASVSRRPGLAQPLPGGDALRNYTPDVHDPFYVPRGVYALDPSCGSLLRYSWCTPDFILGTSMVAALPQEAWTNISSQNRWEGVVFAGHPTARIFFQPFNPPRGSVYNAYWSVENKGVLVVQRLRGSNAQGHRVWLDASLKTVERRGWIFAAAPRAYAAVRVVEGPTEWQSDTVAQHHEGKGPTDLGRWLNCRQVFSPVILDVARQSDYPSFEAFQSAVLANPLAWHDKRLDYRSGQHGTTLTLFADYSRPPEVDGRPVDYQAPKAFDSPFIQSRFGSGVVTLTKGERTTVLDFNREEP